MGPGLPSNLDMLEIIFMAPWRRTTGTRGRHRTGSREGLVISRRGWRDCSAVWDRTQFRRRRRLAACVATGPVGDMAWFGPGGSDRAWVAVRDLAAFPCICHFLLQIKSSRNPPLPALELWVQIVFFYDTESLDVFGELALGYLGQSYLAQANSPPIK